MTSHVTRLYALVIGVLAFFLIWALVAAHPWSTASRRTARDPHLVALVLRRERLVRETARVREIVARRWSVYRNALRARNAQIARAQARFAASAAAVPAPAPAARVVTLPPLVITRTS
jgi:Tfp pilus assembly protein FimV